MFYQGAAAKKDVAKMLVVIVGTDGAGKTSLSKAVNLALQRRSIKSSSLNRFGILDHHATPSAGFINSDVEGLRQYALDMHASARLLFYLWSMAVTVTSQMSVAGNQQVIIYDSYWLKHVAVEIAFGADEHLAVAAGKLLPEPDLTIYLKAPPEALYERKIGDLVAYECGLDPTCSRQSFIAHQRRLKERLDFWSSQNGWLEFDALQSTDDLAAALVPIVMDRFSQLQATS
ncbi:MULTISPECIES: nucleoside/nucleotide kinase family protein [Rhizobium]|uniref:hypothetical protein n=1 Tax=Rhizobium TaxID=379 RepID=UPI0007B51012|nr:MULTISPECIES: hypothetical protein [Rhizobium]KZS56291.1 hypothetical protein AS890_21835 [Rhizobium anhuiense bv. trifolii]MBA9036824.1 thymidylate kinase [Rhizobium leguminosarum]TBB57973.1 hypothetical protein ELH43_40310 [Rhizobium ruizarguesonis]TBF43776.1 hypothetical protein ELG90_36345 [Rhizobium leguminosarum]TBF85877.1 hypothetical protein ELG85_36785 [Rhizobium leguminosarum]